MYTASREMDAVPPGYLLTMQHRYIGVLGGTFNPVHYGHIDIALHAAQEFGLRKVMMVVGGDPPHKKDSTDIAPAGMRLDMVRIATATYPVLRVSDIELHRQGYTYTVDTMRILVAKEPSARFLFIIGEDALFQLETWRDLKKLCQLTEFICFRRRGDVQPASPELQVELLAGKYGAKIHLSDYTGPEISSTMIRRRIQNGESLDGLVAPEVEEYIYATGLYV